MSCFLLSVLSTFGITSANDRVAFSLGFVTISGRVTAADGSAVANVRVTSDELFGNRVSTCSDSEGRYELSVPVNSNKRYVRVYLAPRVTLNSNIDCLSGTKGKVPTLNCWSEFGPFTATENLIENFTVDSLSEMTFRIVDGDGNPYLGARIGNGGAVNGQSGGCPLSASSLAGARAFMDDYGDGDVDMDGVIKLVGVSMGLSLKVSAPYYPSPASVSISKWQDQTVVLPLQQGLPPAPNSVLVQVVGTTAKVRVDAVDDGKSPISKIRVTAGSQSLMCEIAKSRFGDENECQIADLEPGASYIFTAAASNGRGEGPWKSTGSVLIPSRLPSTGSPTLTSTGSNVGLTLRSGSKIGAKSIASLAKIAVPSSARISVKVSSSSARVCRVAGATVRGVKAGTCRVTITVTPKRGRPTLKQVTLKFTAT